MRPPVLLVALLAVGLGSIAHAQPPGAVVDDEEPPPAGTKPAPPRPPPPRYEPPKVWYAGAGFGLGPVWYEDEEGNSYDHSESRFEVRLGVHLHRKITLGVDLSHESEKTGDDPAPSYNVHSTIAVSLGYWPIRRLFTRVGIGSTRLREEEYDGDLHFEGRSVLFAAGWRFARYPHWAMDLSLQHGRTYYENFRSFLDSNVHRRFWVLNLGVEFF